MTFHRRALLVALGLAFLLDAFVIQMADWPAETVLAVCVAVVGVALLLAAAAGG